MPAITTDAGLARVVVITPKRRLEIALPEQLPVSVLLPALLRQGGDDLAVEGVTTGGWLLRRVDGAPLDAGRTLASQGVRDGEVLHLVPRHLDWPEPEYDDIVDVIAAGARRAARPWTPAATRSYGLAFTGLTLLMVPVTVLLAGGHWLTQAVVSLALAVLLLAAGTALSRTLADSVAGAVIGAFALPIGLLGGLLLLGGQLPLSRFGAPQLLAGSAAMLLLAAVGYVAVADLRHLFVGGIVASIGGIAGAALAMTNVEGVGAAAVVTTFGLLVSPAFPLLSVRLAKVPMPAVPRDAADLRAGDTAPSFRHTVSRVARSAELLTGMLLGTAASTVAGTAVLAASREPAALLLAGTVSAAYLLRARMLVALRQRAALLVGGVLGLAVTVLGVTLAAPDWARLGVVLPALAVLAALVCASALVYSRRAPSPRLGHLANVSDVVLTLAAGPLTAAVLGLFEFMRGLAG
jgi:type VII secretion integral membrane protein EccD